MRSPILLPGALLNSHLRGDGPATSRRHAQRVCRRYVLGDPGRPAQVSTLLVVISDDSNSVAGVGGSDPLSNRYEEMVAAFSLVARRGSSHEMGAVLHFDSPAPNDVPLLPIRRRTLPQLRRGLSLVPGATGSSELGPALRRAVSLAEAHPRHESTLVVLSDFLLLDSDPARAFADLAAFPGSVHAVVLGDFVRADFFDNKVIVTRIRPGDLPGTVARALFASLVTHRPGSWVAS